ncbi:MAG: hypothetical protein NVS9B4_20760 [Candidatus Acidiferrum sp.]
MQMPSAGTVILAIATFLPQVGPAESQKSTSDLIELVRPAVVQIYVRITDPKGPRESLPGSKPVQDCFGGKPVCIVGTGFFINDAGDVVTASHVAADVQQIIQILETNGISASAAIGVSIPNIETKNLIVASGTVGFPAGCPTRRVCVWD